MIGWFGRVVVVVVGGYWVVEERLGGEEVDI